MDDLFAQIEAARKAQNLTIGKLASEAGISRQHYHSVRHGLKSPSIDWYRRLAAALGLELRLEKSTTPG